MADQYERLVTVWDANFQRLDEKLNKIQRSHFKAASIIKKDADNLTRRLEDRYGAVGRAMGNVFDDSRLAAINAGSSRLSVFGSALEPLGPAGFAAAAGIAALAVASQQTIAAMRFADEIDDAAQKLNIGVEALQEYRFAMTEVGGEAADADKALEGFNKTLGSAQSGLSPRAMKGFTALGFTADQLRSFSSGEEALAEVARRVSALSKESERAAVVEKLGLGPMLPLLREGAEEMERLREKARDLGYVMDADLVRKGAEANQQFETMARVIDVQLKSAFVGLSDEVLGFVDAIADALGALNRFLDRASQLRTRLNAMYGDDFVTEVANGNAGQALYSAVRSVANGRAGAAARIIQSGGDLGSRGPVDRDALADLARGDRPAGGGAELDRPSSRGGGSGARRADREAEQRRQRQERFEEQLRRIQEEIIRAGDQQLLSIDDSALAETQRLERERREGLRQIAEQQAEYARTNGLRGLSEVEAEQLAAAQTELAEQQKAVVEWRRRRDLAAYRLETEEEAADHALALLDFDAEIARTHAQRIEAERRILIATQEIARKREEARLAEDNELTPEQRAERMARFDERGQRQLQIFDQREQDRLRETFRDYGREVVQAIQDGRIGEWIGDRIKERLLTMALDGLFDAIGGGKSGGGLGGFIRSLIPGFATGTSGAPGGLAYVHKGEVLANLKAGTQVIPAHAVRAMGLLAGDVPSGRSRQVVEHRITVSPERDSFIALASDAAVPVVAQGGAALYGAQKQEQAMAQRRARQRFM